MANGDDNGWRIDKNVRISPLFIQTVIFAFFAGALFVRVQTLENNFDEQKKLIGPRIINKCLTMLQSSATKDTGTLKDIRTLLETQNQSLSKFLLKPPTP